jgi:hypothetical protein
MALVPAVAALSVFAAGLGALAAGAGGGLGWIGVDTEPGQTLSPAAEALARWNERPMLGHGLNSLDSLAAAPSALRWLAETGYLGALLGTAAILTLGFGLAVMKDRGRPISRGFILLTGLVAFALTESLLSPAFDQPAAMFALAVLAGVAISYLDFESTRRARNPNPA